MSQTRAALMSILYIGVLFVPDLSFRHQAQPIRDILEKTNAPNENKAVVERAPNGVPLVQIASPNHRGVSHNLFRKFNVGRDGVILNNSSTDYERSLLGGILPANQRLTPRREASLIINEVQGPHRSRLYGFTEVHGKKAEYILANPYGIYCQGCGFINIPRLTLSTGRPSYDANGNIDHFLVRTGEIVIGDHGLNASEINHLSIVGRSAKIHGRLDAKDLKLYLGASVYGYHQDQILHGNIDGYVDTPLYALDATALGAMYADRIYLEVRESGLGVRLAGDMAAKVDDLVIRADGSIEFMKDSQSTARNTIELTSKQSINMGKDSVFASSSLFLRGTNSDYQGQIYAGVNPLGQILHLSIPSSEPIAMGLIRIFLTGNQGILSSESSLLRSSGNIEIVSEGAISFQGEIDSGTSLLMQAANDISLGRKVSSQKGSLSIQSVSGAVHSTGSLYADKSISISSNDTMTLHDLSAGTEIALRSNHDIVGGGKWATYETLDEDSNAIGNIEIVSGGAISFQGEIDSSSSLLMQAANDISLLGGKVSSQKGNLSITSVSGAVHSTGSLYANKLLNISSNDTMTLHDLSAGTEIVLSSKQDIVGRGKWATYETLYDDSNAISYANSAYILASAKNNISLEDAFLYASGMVYLFSSSINIQDSKLISGDLLFAKEVEGGGAPIRASSIIVSGSESLIRSQNPNGSIEFYSDELENLDHSHIESRNDLKIKVDTLFRNGEGGKLLSLGDLLIHASQGDIHNENHSLIQSEGIIDMIAIGKVTSTSRLYSMQSIMIDSGQIQVAGISSGESIILNTSSLGIESRHSFEAVNDISLISESSINFAKLGNVKAGGDISFQSTSGNIHIWRDLISHGSLRFTAEKGRIFYQGTGKKTLQAANNLMLRSKILASDKFSLRSGVGLYVSVEHGLRVDGDFDIQSRGHLELESKKGSIILDRNLSAAGDLTLKTPNQLLLANYTTGQSPDNGRILASGGDMFLYVGSLKLRRSSLYSQGDMILANRCSGDACVGMKSLENLSGNIISKGDMSIYSNYIENKRATFQVGFLGASVPWWGGTAEPVRNVFDIGRVPAAIAYDVGAIVHAPGGKSYFLFPRYLIEGISRGANEKVSRIFSKGDLSIYAKGEKTITATHKDGNSEWVRNYSLSASLHNRHGSIIGSQRDLTLQLEHGFYNDHLKLYENHYIFYGRKHWRKKLLDSRCNITGQWGALGCREVNSNGHPVGALALNRYVLAEQKGYWLEAPTVSGHHKASLDIYYSILPSTVYYGRALTVKMGEDLSDELTSHQTSALTRDGNSNSICYDRYSASEGRCELHIRDTWYNWGKFLKIGSNHNTIIGYNGNGNRRDVNSWLHAGSNIFHSTRSSVTLLSPYLKPSVPTSVTLSPVVIPTMPGVDDVHSAFHISDRIHIRNRDEQDIFSPLQGNHSSIPVETDLRYLSIGMLALVEEQVQHFQEQARNFQEQQDTLEPSFLIPRDEGVQEQNTDTSQSDFRDVVIRKGCIELLGVHGVFAKEYLKEIYPECFDKDSNQSSEDDGDENEQDLQKRALAATEEVDFYWNRDREPNPIISQGIFAPIFPDLQQERWEQELLKEQSKRRESLALMEKSLRESREKDLQIFNDEIQYQENMDERDISFREAEKEKAIIQTQKDKKKVRKQIYERIKSKYQHQLEPLEENIKKYTEYITYLENNASNQAISAKATDILVKVRALKEQALLEKDKLELRLRDILESGSLIDVEHFDNRGNLNSGNSSLVIFSSKDINNFNTMIGNGLSIFAKRDVNFLSSQNTSGSKTSSSSYAHIHAGRNFTQQGSSLETQDDLAIEAIENINIVHSIKTDDIFENTQKKEWIPLGRKTTTKTTHIHRQTAQGSSTKGRNISFKAGETLLVQGSDIAASGHLDIDVTNLYILSAENSENISETTSTTESTMILEAGKIGAQVEHTASNSKTTKTFFTSSSLKAGGSMSIQSKEDINIIGSSLNSSGMIDMEAGNDINIKGIREKDCFSSSKDTDSFRISVNIQTDLEIGYGNKKDDQGECSQKILGASLIGEQGLRVHAGNKLSSVGSSIGSFYGNTDLFGENGVELSALEENDFFRSTSSSFDFSASVNIASAMAGSVDGSVNFEKNQSQENSSSTRHQITKVFAQNGTLNIKTGKNASLRIKGAEVVGNNVNIDTASLLLESLQNCSDSKSHSSESNLNIDISLKGGGFGAGGSLEDSESSRCWIDEQSKIIGYNSVNIDVENDAKIIGGVIANQREDGSDGGNLSMNVKGSLEVKDIQDFHREKTETGGFSVGLNVSANKLKGMSFGLQGGGKGKNQKGVTRATIGSGHLSVGKGAPLNINRNLENSSEVTHDDIYDNTFQLGASADLKKGEYSADIKVKGREYKLKSGKGIQNALNLAAAVADVAGADKVAIGLKAASSVYDISEDLTASFAEYKKERKKSSFSIVPELSLTSDLAKTTGKTLTVAANTLKGMGLKGGKSLEQMEKVGNISIILGETAQALGESYQKLDKAEQEQSKPCSAKAKKAKSCLQEKEMRRRGSRDQLKDTFIDSVNILTQASFKTLGEVIDDGKIMSTLARVASGLDSSFKLMKTGAQLHYDSVDFSDDVKEACRIQGKTKRENAKKCSEKRNRYGYEFTRSVLQNTGYMLQSSGGIAHSFGADSSSIELVDSISQGVIASSDIVSAVEYIHNDLSEQTMESKKEKISLSSSSSSSSSKTKTHTIARGETLEELANQYNLSHEELLDANPRLAAAYQKNQYLITGQKWKLPVKKSTLSVWGNGLDYTGRLLESSAKISKATGRQDIANILEGSSSLFNTGSGTMNDIREYRKESFMACDNRDKKKDELSCEQKNIDRNYGLAVDLAGGMKGLFRSSFDIAVASGTDSGEIQILNDLALGMEGVQDITATTQNLHQNRWKTSKGEPREKGAGSKAKEHTVSKGETLSQIATQYGISQEEILQANPELAQAYNRRGKYLITDEKWKIPASKDDINSGFSKYLSHSRIGLQYMSNYAGAVGKLAAAFHQDELSQWMGNLVKVGKLVQEIDRGVSSGYQMTKLNQRMASLGFSSELTLSISHAAYGSASSESENDLPHIKEASRELAGKASNPKIDFFEEQKEKLEKSMEKSTGIGVWKDSLSDSSSESKSASESKSSSESEVDKKVAKAIEEGFRKLSSSAELQKSFQKHIQEFFASEEISNETREEKRNTLKELIRNFLTPNSKGERGKWQSNRERGEEIEKDIRENFSSDSYDEINSKLAILAKTHSGVYERTQRWVDSQRDRVRQPNPPQKKRSLFEQAGDWVRDGWNRLLRPSAAETWRSVKGGKYSQSTSAWETGAAQEILPALKELMQDPDSIQDPKTRDWLKKMKDNPEQAAKDSSAALCNVISYYLFLRLQGARGIPSTLAQFYQEEVLKGNITVKSHKSVDGQRQGLFFGQGSGQWRDRWGIRTDSFERNKQGVDDKTLTNAEISALEESQARVAIVHVDTNNDKRPNHFFLIRKDESGEWNTMDHTGEYKDETIKLPKVHRVEYMPSSSGL